MSNNPNKSRDYNKNYNNEHKEYNKEYKEYTEDYKDYNKDYKEYNEDYNEPNEYKGVRTLILSIATALFAVTLFDAMYDFKSLINPGISKVYNALGTQIEPNMVTLVVFDWRGYDTLGEALILVTAVVVVLLIFGRGLVDGKENQDEAKEEK